MRLCGIGSPILLVTCLALLAGLAAQSQICPPNIDFETGTFNGWNCYTGTTVVQGDDNVILLNNSGPVHNRHTMYSRNAGTTFDPYGGFPVICPNGSGYSVKLGNNTAGTEAEGMSYEFTIPLGQNVYSLIYHYAVVFQDPNHQIFQQPRLVLEITNVTDNKLIDCSSFTFIPYGSLLPGFFESPNPGGDVPVWCKDWTAVSINLNDLAGKRIRLFFKTADCTFRRHFGYAYIDVNTECNSEFVGAAYCPDDTVVNVTAPYGYQSYTWYNTSFTQVLGSTQTISIAPLPVPGTTYAVKVVPYHGYGCVDTFYARLEDTLTVISNAGGDMLSCNHSAVPIGAIPKPGLVYSWSPTIGLSNPTIANPTAAPPNTTTYVLTTRHDGGGCRSVDSVVVTSSVVDDSLQLAGSAVYCVTSGDSAVLTVQPADNIQWYKDGRIILGATQRVYKVTQSGTYHAVLSNNDGCSTNTPLQTIDIDIPKPGVAYPVQHAVLNLPLDLAARRLGNNVLWKPASSLNTATSFTPVFKGSNEQLYTIEISKTGGCTTVDTQLVKIIKRIEVFVPNAFTPNNDGHNETLKPIARGFKEIRYFRIYNRWGNMVFESNSLTAGWNGTLNGVAQPSQTFVWTLEGVGLDGHVYREKGVSILLR
ncbi:MAG TPA: gliding motility-associated C-terminal domain-containing protein [Chitinophagaceae bacterium]|nr:gliding motility-associated C-terminal domain-containing protein [Chitinophagaceae bacterium]